MMSCACKQAIRVVMPAMPFVCMAFPSGAMRMEWMNPLTGCFVATVGALFLVAAMATAQTTDLKLSKAGNDIQFDWTTGAPTFAVAQL